MQFSYACVNFKVGSKYVLTTRYKVHLSIGLQYESMQRYAYNIMYNFPYFAGDE